MTKKSNKEEFIKKARLIHGDKYDYSKVEYIDNNTNVCIICPKHGEFWQTPSNHLSGKGCRKCSYELRAKKGTLTKEEFIKGSKKTHGDKYDYSKVEYVGSTTKVCIICPEHGEFYQTPSSHIYGCGCPYCSNNAKLDFDSFVKLAREVHGDKYDYSKVDYINSATKVRIICPEHGEFWQTPNNHTSKKYGCPSCSHIISKKEKEIYDYVSMIVGKENVIENCRDIIPPYELDIYIPSKSLAIEFNGLRWHSEEFEKDKLYHLNKTLECKKYGIKLIHIFEDEWEDKKDIVKSIINNNLSRNNVVYARRCKLEMVTPSISKNFLNKNHIQGGLNSSINIGLFYNNELVSVMTFGKKRINLGYKPKTENVYEMLRFSTKLGTTVVGGASKMFKYFVEKYNPDNVVSFCDLRFFNGETYKKLGFTFIHASKPNYFYVIKDHRENRFKYRKDVLVKEGYDKNKSEHEIMLERGIYRIYDCGCNVYLYDNTNKRG